MNKRVTIYKKGNVSIADTYDKRQQHIRLYGDIIAEYLPDLCGWWSNGTFVETSGVVLDDMCCIAKSHGIKKLVLQEREMSL